MWNHESDEKGNEAHIKAMTKDKEVTGEKCCTRYKNTYNASRTKLYMIKLVGNLRAKEKRQSEETTKTRRFPANLTHHISALQHRNKDRKS
jgi:hypothetical protein